MIYNSHRVSILLRIFILFMFMLLLAFSIIKTQYYFAIFSAIGATVSVIKLHKFLIKRFVEIDDFFEAVKYRDFSRRFIEDRGPRDIRQLHKGFNEINRVIREINSKKEVQYLYLQKILEMVDIGIIAFNLETGDVLWANESIKKTLDLPSFKNISFVERRKPILFEEIFDSFHSEATPIILTIKNEKLKVLISTTVFRSDQEACKLIVLQNIDETLNKNESDAWKKLLSVMTHEIMNSIAPISSLAETLETQVKLSSKYPEKHILDMEDLDAGITSIKKRSEGLMKFAKTYRSLNKITHLNLETIYVRDLFQNLQPLLKPSLTTKQILLTSTVEPPDLKLVIDIYLIEQVLINLILNAIDASEASSHPEIQVLAKKDVDNNIMLLVSDNGTGIPPEILDSIFIPFFTTKKDGSGIGLSLCKQIMMLHKGKIILNSIEGKGTAVKLVF